VSLVVYLASIIIYYYPEFLKSLKAFIVKMRTTIKELRARYDLTQDQLAAIVGVSRRTMLYLEKGAYNPSLFLAAKVAKNAAFYKLRKCSSSRRVIKYQRYSLYLLIWPNT